MGFADRREPFAFFGAILLNVLLGSLYCWSCYLVPLEQALGVGRGLLSGVFSLTTVCFTVAVAKIGPGLYSRLNPAVIGAGAAVVAGAGLLLASQALPYVSVVPLFFGYALLFGVAAGVGYGLSVQISAIAPFGEGLSTGLVTSARAIGAFAFTPVIRRLLDVGGPGHAMWTVGALLLASSAPLWVMLSRGGLDEPLANGRRDASEALTPEETERNRQLRPALITVWAALCLGVQAGLMVVSHAAALLRTHGASISIATAGVSIVSAFSTLGRVLGGVEFAIDRASAPRRCSAARRRWRRRRWRGPPPRGTASSRRRRRSRRRRSRTECSPAPFLWRFDDALDVEIFRARTVSCTRRGGWRGLRRPRWPGCSSTREDRTPPR